MVNEQEVKVEESVATINKSLLVQRFLNENRETLMKEIPNLITADFHDTPPRVVLTVSSLLKTVPVKEFEGEKIVFEQMVLGGVIIQKEASPEMMKTFSSSLKDIGTTTEKEVFGTECIGPHNAKSNNKAALEAWQKRNANVKVVK